MPSPRKPDQPRKGRRKQPPPTSFNLDTAARLEEMMRGRIKALERDQRRLQAEVTRLRDRLEHVLPENARLEEALAHAEGNSVYATVLMGVGGFLVSFATFTGKAATMWANVAAGCLLAGVELMLWQRLLRWLRAARG